MDPLPHPRVTARFGAPRNWDADRDGPCGTLEVAAVSMAPGVNGFESLWRPTVEELDLLNDGGAVSLWIFAVQHPVVSIGVRHPDEQP